MSPPLATADELRLTDRQVRRGLGLNILAGCLGNMWVAVALNMPYTMLLDALGANGVLQGLAATAIQLTLAAQIPGAFFLETLRRRRVAWAVIAIVHRVIWFVPAYVAWLHPRPPIGAHIVVAIATLSMVFSNFAAAAWHSWMADLVPETTRGRFWSERQAWTMLAFLAAMAAAGVGLDRLQATEADGPLRGFALLFGAATVLGVVDIIIHLGVPEPVPQRTPREHSFVDRLIAPLQNPDFRRLAIAMGLWMFSCTLVGAFGQLYLKHVFGASYGELSVLAIASSLGTVVAGLVAGYLIDRIGARAFGAVMILVAPFFGASWFLVTDTPLRLHVPLTGLTVDTTWAMATMIVASLFSAGFYSSVGLSHMSLLASSAPARGRTLAMAVQWTIIGLLGAGGPILGGYVMDLFPKEGLRITLLKDTRFHFVHALTIMHAAIAWLFVLPIFLRIRAKGERFGMLAAFDRVVLVNPVRFASGIYHARVMAAPVTRRRRARAVQAAGEAGAEVVVADLAARLADPSSDVREAAALSLGRIGTVEAVDALMQGLREPGTDLTVPLVRALRLCADPRATPALLPLLRHENLEVVREAARALGATGDPAAVHPLLDLLHRTRHDAVAVAAAEALGRLGDPAAVYQILPRMRAAANPMARRAFAASAGDLLGEPDGFYRILTEEEAAHGTGVGPLIARLRYDLRAAQLPFLRRTVAAVLPSASAASRANDALVAEIDSRYEARDVPACAAAAFRLGIVLAERRTGVRYDGNAFAFLAHLNHADPRFAVAAWYLAVLNGAFRRPGSSPALDAARELVEVQLAIYILASWSRDPARLPAAP